MLFGLIKYTVSRNWHNSCTQAIKNYHTKSKTSTVVSSQWRKRISNFSLLQKQERDKPDLTDNLSAETMQDCSDNEVFLENIL